MITVVIGIVITVVIGIVIAVVITVVITVVIGAAGGREAPRLVEPNGGAGGRGVEPVAARAEEAGGLLRVLRGG